MDRYETRLRADIASCDEHIVRLKAEIEAQTVRKGTLKHALSVYAETRPRSPARRDSRGRRDSYASRVLDVIRGAGTRGLTTSEIYQGVREAGFDVREGNIRSLLYDRRKAGVLERLENGRHRFVSFSANDSQTQNSEATTSASPENEATTDASETGAGSAAGASGTSFTIRHD